MKYTLRKSRLKMMKYHFVNRLRCSDWRAVPYAILQLCIMSLLVSPGCSCPDDGNTLTPPTDDVIPTVDSSAEVDAVEDTLVPEDQGVIEPDIEVQAEVSQCAEDTECDALLAVANCQQASCIEGQCLATPVEDGLACDNGDACIQGSVCTGGVCGGGTALACDDKNPCTIDSCANGRCVATPQSNGEPCNDDNECTEGDICFAGDCKGGTNICVELCDNDIDDDLNGATDCEDFACAPNDECKEVCTLIGTLQCGSTTTVLLEEITGSEKISFWGCAGESYPGEELGYAFVSTEPVTATVTLSASTAGTRLFVLSEDATTCAKNFCVDTSDSAVTFLATSDAAPTLVVDTPADAVGDVTLEVTCEVCTPNCNGKICGADGCGGVCGLCGVGAACSAGLCVDTPDNDDCSTPIYINSDQLPAIQIGDTSAASDDLFLPTGNPCTGGASAGLGGRDVIYSYTPAETREYLIAVDAAYDSTVYVITSCEDAASTCTAVSSSTGTQDEQIVAELSQGVQYLIVVDGSSSAASGPFTLTVNTYPCNADCAGKQCGPDGCGATCGNCGQDLSCTADGQCVILAENDDCTTPSSIVSLPFFGTGNTSAANDDYVVFPEVCPGGPAFGLAGDGAPDLVYEVGVDESGKYLITATPDGDYDVMLSVRKACPGSSQQCLAGADLGGKGAPEQVEVILSNAQTVFIIVDGSALGEQGEFTLAVEKLECTPNCTGKTCGADGCGGQCGTCLSAEVCTDVGTCVAVPTNDTCTASKVIDALPYNDSGTLFGATADYSVPPNSCTGGPTSATYGAGPDVVYSYTAPVTQTVKFSFDQVSTDFISYLFAVNDCSNIAQSCFASPVSAVPGGSILQVPMLAGETIFLVVSGWSISDIGNYTLLASEG